MNKTIYTVTKMIKHTEEEGKGMSEYTSYELTKKNTVKTLVHNKKTNDFTLWGKRAGYQRTMTIPKHIELVKEN